MKSLSDRCLEKWYVSDKIFGQNERQSWASGNLRGDNDFADMTLAIEDDQLVDAPKGVLAEQQLGVGGLASLALVLRWEGGDGRHWLILGRAGVVLYLQEQEL